MCNCCSAPTGLSIDQGRTLSIIRTSYGKATVYDSGIDGKALVVSNLGSEYHFWLIDRDGTRQKVTDLLNQSHWLEGILSGQYTLIR